MLFTSSSLDPPPTHTHILAETASLPLSGTLGGVRGIGGGVTPARHEYSTRLKFLWPHLLCHKLQKKHILFQLYVGTQ